MIEFGETLRGFSVGKFVDEYGLSCSIQKSSLATDDAIWLGINDPKPEIMASHAERYGIEVDKKVGWVSFPIPDEVLIHTRMHLTREQVRELLPVLQEFVETGEINE